MEHVFNIRDGVGRIDQFKPEGTMSRGPDLRYL